MRPFKDTPVEIEERRQRRFMSERITRCWRVYGIVQGVGFRPTVSRHAAACQITGSVSNKGPYVEIFAQGTPGQVAAFRRLLEEEPPKRAVILKIREFPVSGTVEAKQDGMPVFREFSIIESEKTKGEIFISPDIAICEDCKRELYDPVDRRYLHPFINCTCCGPRLTILDALPYDRERTSMKEFPMCPDCAAEYYSPATRRYDAQPVCCNACGPEVYLIGRQERGREAITYTRRVIKEGGIAAIKGIGGFHLCCDASNPEAVTLLRTRKKRPMKPFAVMAKDLQTARRECVCSDAQAQILDGYQKPILLLRRKESGKVCAACAPDNPKLGIMLPYAPLQLLLFDYDDGIDMPDCLVMTSANTSGAPICRDDADAVRELTHLCDCMLSHNRMIRIRADDTVMDFYKGEPYMIRRSRGYAPLPVPVSAGFTGQVLGIGGELKNEFCIGVNDLFYISPYVGDLEDLRTVTALTETVSRFETLLEAEPALVSCDLHPLYNSSEAARGRGLPVCELQHHYAHVLSCMAENDWLGKTIGVSFDGTGYGTDQTIWGGEILISDLDRFRRAARIAPFLQIGGDLSAKQGWRIAAAMILSLQEDKTRALDVIRRLRLCSASEANVLAAMAKNHINTVRSTSCGRLFDAAAAILGIRRESTFEGEAANALMYRALAWREQEDHSDFTESGNTDGRETESGSKSLPDREAGSCLKNVWNLEIDSGSKSIRDRETGGCPKNKQGPGIGREPDTRNAGIRTEKETAAASRGEGFLSPKETEDGLVLPTDRLIAWLIRERLAGTNTSALAYEFHRRLAQMTVAACLKISRQTGIRTVALTGGVFQNTLFLELCEDELAAAGCEVLRHHLVPPNDGGISLGQAVWAMNRLQETAGKTNGKDTG